jgi:peptidoglycan/LPS O-acetylase OafA/YrhL
MSQPAACVTVAYPETSSPERLSSHHIRSLDGFRGLAFLLVFVRHYALSSHATSPMIQHMEAIGSGGWMGVDLFFTLSGFLITGILLDTRDTPHYLRNFYVRRALRIFPLYYGLFLLLFLLTPFLHLQWRPGHLAYLFYAGNIAYNLDPTLAQIKPAIEMMHFWSLAIEEQFYFIWPFLILLIPTRKALVRTCFALSAAGLVLRCLLVHWSLGAGSEWAYAELPTHMDGLLAGALAASWYRELPLQTILARARWILPLSAAALAGIIVYSGHPNFISYGMATIGFPVIAIFFVSILLFALQPGTLANRLGGTPILRFFGKYGYGMYIFHYIFSPATSGLQPILQARLHSVVLGGFAYITLVFLGTIAISVLSFNLYERHWLRLKSKFSYSPSNV